MGDFSSSDPLTLQSNIEDFEFILHNYTLYYSTQSLPVIFNIEYSFSETTCYYNVIDQTN